MSNNYFRGSKKNDNNNNNYRNNNGFNRSGGNYGNNKPNLSMQKEVLCGKIFRIKAEGENKEKAENNFFHKFCDEVKNFFPDNLSLALTKYIWIVLKERIDNSYDNQNSPINQLAKIKELFEIIRKDKSIKNVNPPKIAQLEGYEKILDKRYKTTERLICGLGESNVLETSITLHHISGIPYIPASTFKGVCREVAFWNLIEKRNIDQEKLNEFQENFYGELYEDDEDIIKYQLLFGAKDFKGLLLFFDSYPEFKDSKYKNEDFIDLDIMNPHYTKYYNDEKGETVPGDWENPTPIFFLTVKQNTTFHFDVFFDRWRWEKIKKNGIEIKREKKIKKIIFYDKKDGIPEKKNGEITIEIDRIEQLVDRVKFDEDIIKKALGTFGIGAKTMLGYGIFE